MSRKLLLSLLLITFAALNMPAQEQKVTWGARLSMDITFPTGNSNPYKVGSGFSAGAVAAVKLPRNFYFEPGLMFYYTGMSSKNLVSFDKDYFYQGTGAFYGFRIPVSVGYSFNVNEMTRLSVSTGPYMNINVSARQNLIPNMSAPVPLPDVKTNLFDHGWKRVDAGWQVNFGTTFAENYYVGITGGVNFTPLASLGNTDKKVKIYRNSLLITLGYNF